MSFSLGFDSFKSATSKPFSAIQRSTDNVALKIAGIESDVDNYIAYGNHAVGVVDSSLRTVENYGRQISSIANKVTSLFSARGGESAEGGLSGFNMPEMASFTTRTSLSYPKEPGRFFMMLQIGPWARPSRSTSYQATRFMPDVEIVLPIPQGLQENFSLEYNTVPMDMFGDALAFADNIMGAEGENVADGATKTAVGAVAGGTAGAIGALGKGFGSKAMTAAFARRASGLVNDKLGAAVSQYVGAIPNPHLSASFQGTTFRRHTFRYKFSPANAEESVEIKQICDTLKARSLPSTDENSIATILNYPDIVQVSMYPNNEFLPKFKKAVITDLGINYAPNGIPAFFQGSNAPVMIELTIALMEIEYYTANDITGSDDFGRARGFGALGAALDDMGDITTAVKDGIGAVMNTAGDLFKGFGL